MFFKLNSILTLEKKNNFDGSVFIYRPLTPTLFMLGTYASCFLLILYKFINVQITFFFVLQKLFLSRPTNR